ncbi:hypothetical protein ACVU7I_12480, partial [Patulibacter sp. S7RM1-6]
MPDHDPPAPPAPSGPAARFRPAHPANARLALELIADPSSLPADALRPLLREAALRLPALAAAAHGFSLQQRLTLDLGLPTLDVTRARLQREASGIAGRLLAGAAALGPPPGGASTWIDQAVAAADA